MENNKLKVEKIPLLPLIQLLQDLYEKGAEFIDIESIKQAEGEQDIIAIGLPAEYMKGYIEFLPAPKEEPLSDEDIDKLTQ
jgi:hypothetical protein